MNTVVSFERKGNGTKKITKKIRRESVPGIIELIEMSRASEIETIADINLRNDKFSWYNHKDE